MKKLAIKSLGIALPIFLFVLHSCSKDNEESKVPVKQIKLASSAALGSYLTDKDGRTLYYFSNDANGQNTCTGGCEALWPIFNVDNLTADQLGENLSLTDFTTVTTSSGKKQAAYKGWPLYYYAPAVNGINALEAPGQTTGENVGGIWFVAKPDYTIMIVNAQLVGHDGKNYTSTYTEGTSKTKYFTDGNGLTIYAFKIDKQNKNNYTKPDFSNNALWPIYETDKAVVPSSLDKTLFGSIDVFGKKQLTYKGWPLYYFQQDANVRGNNKGMTFPSLGVWPVVQQNMAAATP